MAWDWKRLVVRAKWLPSTILPAKAANLSEREDLTLLDWQKVLICRITGKREVSADLRSDGPPVQAWDWRKSTGRWQAARLRLGPTLRRTSALVTEWSQNRGHSAKLSCHLLIIWLFQ